MQDELLYLADTDDVKWKADVQGYIVIYERKYGVPKSYRMDDPAKALEFYKGMQEELLDLAVNDDAEWRIDVEGYIAAYERKFGVPEAYRRTTPVSKSVERPMTPRRRTTPVGTISSPLHRRTTSVESTGSAKSFMSALEEQEVETEKLRIGGNTKH